MAKTTGKNTIKVKFDIRFGPVSPAQETAWRKFWQKLIAEVEASEQ